MKIAFGSCSKIQDQAIQPAWKAIQEESPDHLLLLGDNVYSPWRRWDHKKLEKRYKQQFKEPNFRRLIQEVPYNAIWDDHDFGPNDIKGAHVKEHRRLKSRELFHRYMNCSTNLPHVYHSFEIGYIKVIMLDVRFYREKPRTRKNATLLGVEQEAWLERELQHDKKFTIVCSGSCMVDGGEKIEKYDEYFPRLQSMLREKGRTLFLSGDIHENKFINHDGFYEVISSGIGRDECDNYGLLHFDEDRIGVELRGNRKRNNGAWAIDPETWELTGVFE